MEKKKYFEIPRAIIIEFGIEDIMTSSGDRGVGDAPFQEYDDWGNPIIH